MATNGNIETAQTRHAVFLQRSYSSIASEFDKFLRRAERSISLNLNSYDDLIRNRRELSKIINTNNKELGKIYDEWLLAQNDLLLGLSNQEYNFQSSIHETEARKIAKQLKLAGDDRTIDLIVSSLLSLEEFDGNDVYKEALSQPMILDNKAIGMVNMQQSWKDSEITRVAQVITAGYFAGYTVNEINKQIRGTRKNKFNDGELMTTKRNSDAIVKTQGNHVSTMARETFFNSEDNLDGYKILATLDFRTSEICRSLDGRVFRKADTPKLRPPFHFRCRTVTTAIFKSGSLLSTDGETRASRGAQGGKPVSAKLNYYDWLKTQPASFQDKALGKTKGKIFRDAGLSPEEFRKISVNKFNQPLTIEELKVEDEGIRKLLENGD